MSTTAPPEEVQQKLPHDPRLWARNFLRHPNDPSRPYDFYDDTKDEFLYYLADDEGPMNPEQWGDINILLFARGCLKTFTVATVNAWGVDMYPALESVVTAPVDDQREEVIERFRTKVEQSGMDERMEKNSMRHMKFKNYTVGEDGEKYPSYSHMKSRTAWNEGNKLRGLHGHIGNIDESQDVDEGTFSTFLEAIDRSVPQVDYFPTIFVIGTPKLAGSFFHRLWRMSDQKSWDAESRDWSQQKEPDEFLPEDMQRERDELEEKIDEIEDEIETCDDSGRLEELQSLKQEFQDEIDDMEGFQVRGWHLDQMNSPLHDNREIAFKRETYSKKKFENEVKAKFYTPEHDLITQEDVWAAFDQERRFHPEERFPETDTYLSVDWGGGSGEGAANTVLGVAEETPDGGLDVLNIDILDPDMSSADERDQIATWMEQYNVNVGVVDEGYGDTDREALQDEYGYGANDQQTIYGCWYGNVTDKEEIKWNRFEEEKRFFTTSKTFMVKKMAEDFSAGHITIPAGGLSFDTKQSKGTMIVEQLSAPYTDKRETQGGKNKIVVKSDRNDDVFDMMTYLWIAANKVQSGRTLKQIGSHERPGYR